MRNRRLERLTAVRLGAHPNLRLTDEDMDRIAEVVHRARDQYRSGDPVFWRGGEPEQKFAEALAGLGPEETRFAISLLEQDLARLEERGPDPIIERIDAMEAAIEVRKQLDRGEIDRQEAERRVREIDHASGGAVSRLWKLD